jgi:hypothetical protein
MHKIAPRTLLTCEMCRTKRGSVCGQTRFPLCGRHSSVIVAITGPEEFLAALTQRGSLVDYFPELLPLPFVQCLKISQFFSIKADDVFCLPYLCFYPVFGKRKRPQFYHTCSLPLHYLHCKKNSLKFCWYIFINYLLTFSNWQDPPWRPWEPWTRRWNAASFPQNTCPTSGMLRLCSSAVRCTEGRFSRLMSRSLLFQCPRPRRSSTLLNWNHTLDEILRIVFTKYYLMP